MNVSTKSFMFPTFPEKLLRIEASGETQERQNPPVKTGLKTPIQPQGSSKRPSASRAEEKHQSFQLGVQHMGFPTFPCPTPKAPSIFPRNLRSSAEPRSS